MLPINNTELFYREKGRADETIVFSHGLLMDHRQWDRQVERFADDYRCIAYDHRGQGESRPGQGPMVDMETVYLDAVELIETFDVGPCHFVGLSMGGFAGMRLAARRPDLVKSLTLMDTRAAREPVDNVPKYERLNMAARYMGIDKVGGRVMPILFGETFLESDVHRVERTKWYNRIAGRRKSIYKAVNGVIYRPSVESELKRIEAPTLVLHGEEDEAIPVDEGRHLAEAIADARLEIIPKAGHSSSIENPEAVNEALGRFLEGV